MSAWVGVPLNVAVPIAPSDFTRFNPAGKIPEAKEKLVTDGWIAKFNTKGTPTWPDAVATAVITGAGATATTLK